MRAWRIAKAKRASDLTGQGAAIEGGRWNEQDLPAVYMGLTPAICCLETFVHANGVPTVPMKITCFELPEDPSLYLTPDPKTLPEGWNTLPADSPSIEYGSSWLRSGDYLGLIVPSAVLALEQNVVVNPRHAAIEQVRVIEVFDFIYDKRMFK